MDDYELRIKTASPMQLVLISYELLIGELDAASRSPGDSRAFGASLDKARLFLREISLGLNMEQPLSADLMSIYIYISKLIIDAGARADAGPLDEAVRLLRLLLTGWLEAEKAETDKTPIFETAARIYSGLTYNAKGEPVEYVEDAETDYRA